MLSDIIGQPYAVQVLRNYLRDGHIAGSFLFVGAPHIGKAFAALQFAKAMLCDDPQSGPDCCDTCISCRSIDGGRHPDFRTVRPAGPSRILRIPQVWPREGVKDFPQENALLHDLQFGPVRGKRRVFVMEEADALNEDTANSMLKVLEEPPDYATFILTAPGPSAVLPTIFSRCQTVRFQSVAPEVIEKTLIERDLADAPTARFLAAFCQGQIGTALELAGDQELRTARETVLLTAEQISTSRTQIHGIKLADDLRKAGAKLGAARKDSDGDLSSRQSAVAVLELLAYWYRDLATLRAGGDDRAVINGDHLPGLKSISAGYTEAALMRALELVLAIRSCVERNANAQIAFETLTLQLISLKRRGAGALAV